MLGRVRRINLEKFRSLVAKFFLRHGFHTFRSRLLRIKSDLKDILVMVPAREQGYVVLFSPPQKWPAPAPAENIHRRSVQSQSLWIAAARKRRAVFAPGWLATQPVCLLPVSR